MRYGVFVFDPEGDMGYGVIVGAFKTGERAESKAGTIRRVATHKGREVECVVVNLVPSDESAHRIVDDVF